MTPSRDQESGGGWAALPTKPPQPPFPPPAAQAVHSTRPHVFFKCRQEAISCRSGASSTTPELVSLALHAGQVAVQISRLLLTLHLTQLGYQLPMGHSRGVERGDEGGHQQQHRLLAAALAEGHGSGGPLISLHAP